MAVAAVTAINVRRRVVLLDSGVVAPITNMIDVDGDETDDPAEYFVAIVHLPCGMWACCYLCEFEPSVSH